MLEHHVATYAASTGVTLDVFAPEIVEGVLVDGQVRLTPRPLIFHYIFMRGPIDDIRRFCTTFQGLSLILSHQPGQQNRYVTIPDADLHSFRIIARFYANRLPYYNPADIDLIEGDEVEVVSGDFTGLRGTFIARRGTADGHILVRPTAQMAAIAYNIKADTIRILRFAPDSRRAYDQIDAAVPRILSALQKARSGQPLTPADTAPLSVFLRRYSALEAPNAKFDAKLQALLLTAARLLNDPAAANAAAGRYAARAHSITNPTTLALLHILRPLSRPELPIPPAEQKAILALLPPDPTRDSRLQHLLRTHTLAANQLGITTT